LLALLSVHVDAAEAAPPAAPTPKGRGKRTAAAAPASTSAGHTLVFRDLGAAAGSEAGPVGVLDTAQHRSSYFGPTSREEFRRFVGTLAAAVVAAET
jgi:hypothetical protein